MIGIVSTESDVNGLQMEHVRHSPDGRALALSIALGSLWCVLVTQNLISGRY